MIKIVKLDLVDRKTMVKVKAGDRDCSSECIDREGNQCGTGLVGSISFGLASCVTPNPQPY